MHSSIFLLAVAGASVSANMQALHVPVPNRALEARQTGSSTSEDEGCISALTALEAIITSIPTPPADLESYVETATAATVDPCTLDLPDSLTSEYSAYSTSVVSWYSANSAEINSALSQCTEYSSYESEIAGICTSSAVQDSAATTTAATFTTTTGAATGAKTTAGGATGSSATKSSSSATTAATAGAAMREVGVTGALLAGVMGIAMAL